MPPPRAQPDAWQSAEPKMYWHLAERTLADNKDIRELTKHIVAVHEATAAGREAREEAALRGRARYVQHMFYSLHHVPSAQTVRDVVCAGGRSGAILAEVRRRAGNNVPWLDNPCAVPFGFRTPSNSRALQLFTSKMARNLAAAVLASMPGMEVNYGRLAKFSPIGQYASHMRQSLQQANLYEEVEFTLRNWDQLLEKGVHDSQAVLLHLHEHIGLQDLTSRFSPKKMEGRC